ncbi:3-hydroxybutyryl-CoA dehydrogenase [Amycolatopsis cihanbeyliensis]|uniref:3-hydroxyacyl-CoA dehydrogenase n=1 Tax=Amycolatopsis cihanbeyliensis TaxID=1128664 RepID=A0A542DKE1_AMYCI|nr:3-hydroxybutyryl-CoA dehydrogenase [Amycolatopsis cihanbeyliensis]TQJ03537.1 3-hydroxyacyl-CoA dehydrogenase [Amycolatopsis cihanbeyliensis]
MPDIQRVGVIGAGLMGSGIAEVHAKAGLDVTVTEVDRPALDAGKARIEKSLQRAVRNGKLANSDAEAALAKLTFSTDLEAFADRDLVIEAVLEQEQAKVDVFRSVDKVVRREDAIFASNTSSIPIMKLGMATERPQQVVGIHFFNPVPVLPLVELVPSLLTSEETSRRADSHVTEALGKTVIRSQDRAGFIVNSLLVPYLLSAIRMIESGFASAEDIDRGMELGTAHPMGPLRLSDLIGLDTIKAIADSMYAEFKEPLYSSPPLLLRMVDAGLLGKKTGRGFYSYE